MMADTEVTELVPMVIEPQRLAQSPTPEGTIQLASRMATALRDIVDKQQLYTLINGKKYPQVEAWMTIGRMDNVVAREAEPPIRHDDGSYEAYVELVRLSDGMVVGRASALCGMPDDAPWGGTPQTKWKPAQPPRAEYARRSMAVTRATSRAFRQQYSWIMALAGYEPTPADEMPHDTRDVTPRGVEPAAHDEPIEHNGIGRDLYEDSPRDTGRADAPSSARPAVASHDEPEFAPLEWDSVPRDTCPIHHTPWTGPAGDLWHGPKGVVPTGYCRHPENVKKTAGARR